MAFLLRNLVHSANATQMSRFMQISIGGGLKFVGYNINVLGWEQRYINTTAVMLAEPMKKKKKTDPALIRAREERKRRRLEKQIRRMEKFQRQRKPLDELEVPLAIVDEARQRTRSLPQLSTEVSDARWKLVKQWGIYKKMQAEAEFRFFHRMKQSQSYALEELQMESPTLYELAVKVDPEFLSYETAGPTDTPPNESYSAVDGDYIDVSRKWD